MKDFSDRSGLHTPAGHTRRGWSGQSTSLVAPPPDRVPPHLEWFLAQLVVPVRCAMRRYSYNLPFWPRSVWWPAFFRYISHLLHWNTPFLHYYLPVLLVPLSRHRATTLSFSHPFVAPYQPVGVSSPGGGTRVSFYLGGVWDVVACILIISWRGSTTLPSGGSLPLPPLGHGICHLVHGVS